MRIASIYVEKRKRRERERNSMSCSLLCATGRQRRSGKEKTVSRAVSRGTISKRGGINLQKNTAAAIGALVTSLFLANTRSRSRMAHLARLNERRAMSLVTYYQGKPVVSSSRRRAARGGSARINLIILLMSYEQRPYITRPVTTTSRSATTVTPSRNRTARR